MVWVFFFAGGGEGMSAALAVADHHVGELLDPGLAPHVVDDGEGVEGLGDAAGGGRGPRVVLVVEGQDLGGERHTPPQNQSTGPPPIKGGHTQPLHPTLQGPPCGQQGPPQGPQSPPGDLRDPPRDAKAPLKTSGTPPGTLGTPRDSKTPLETPKPPWRPKGHPPGYRDTPWDIGDPTRDLNPLQSLETTPPPRTPRVRPQGH